MPKSIKISVAAVGMSTALLIAFAMVNDHVTAREGRSRHS